MKIAAVVILYQPGSATIQNIASYVNFVDRVFVYDNSERNSGIGEHLQQFSNVEYYSDGCNEGIAKRLNQALDQAWLGGYDFLLTMDQDTSFTETVLAQYITCLHNFKGKEKVAMFGLRYSKHLQESNPGCAFEEVENIITSGTLLNLKLAHQIERFDENLFIDSVDHDYAIRSRALDYKIIRFSHLFLVHHLGNEVYRASIKTLYLKKKRKIVHSPLRCYYMYRNMLYLEKKHQNTNAYMASRLRKLVTNNLLTNFFYGRNALATIKYLAKARNDFSSGKMGKISD